MFTVPICTLYYKLTQTDILYTVMSQHQAPREQASRVWFLAAVLLIQSGISWDMPSICVCIFLTFPLKLWFHQRVAHICNKGIYIYIYFKYIHIAAHYKTTTIFESNPMQEHECNLASLHMIQLPFIQCSWVRLYPSFKWPFILAIPFTVVIMLTKICPDTQI